MWTTYFNFHVNMIKFFNRYISTSWVVSTTRALWVGLAGGNISFYISLCHWNANSICPVTFRFTCIAICKMYDTLRNLAMTRRASHNIYVWFKADMVVWLWPRHNVKINQDVCLEPGVNKHDSPEKCDGKL